jgi:hypothetical protein
MINVISVTKRNGDKEVLDLEKMHKVVFFACEDINGVSPSEVEIKSHLQFYTGITSTEIQETLIKSAADLISEETPNYQWVAGRLVNYHIRKEVYGQFDPIHVFDLVKKNVDLGLYDMELLNSYSAEEWDKINSFIKHERDFSISYVGMEQFRGKYLVQNRVTKQLYETPQMAYILIAASLFSDYPVTNGKSRLQWVKEYYESVSNFEISLPTPVMAGVRTTQKQFSSCVLIETGDSLDSINATSASIVKYVSQKAGIGIGAGSIRAINSPIRHGDASHTGVIPFLKLFQASVKSCLTPDTYVEVLDDDEMNTKKIKIEDLKPGMKIKSFDKETNEVVFCPVEDVWETIVPKEMQRILTFDNGSVINCSSNHPIMAQRDGTIQSIMPDDLSRTDIIVTENGMTTLDTISIDNRDERHYDISVRDTEVFFAQNSLAEEMILTHNCSQGGVRGGAATLYYPIWHLEVEDLLVLKNNKGTEDNRVRHLDYGVQFNKLMYERLIQGGDITLFSPSDVPGLYEAFFADQDKFRELYERAERNTRIRKKTISALELFSNFMNERKNTGRVYLMNVDHANEHGSFDQELAPIRMSNLCTEINLPTKPLNDLSEKGTQRKRIRILKEKYEEYKKYKHDNYMVWLDKERFNGRKNT